MLIICSQLDIEVLRETHYSILHYGTKFFLLFQDQSLVFSQRSLVEVCNFQPESQMTILTFKQL